MSVFILVAVILSLPPPPPPAVFPCGSILFPFVLSIVGHGAVRFCMLSNIPSLHPPHVPFPPPLPHLSLPSILGTPFPSCCICISRIART